MSANLRAPTDRICERCGRRERWDDDAGTWLLARDEGGDPEVGSVACIHEWDINGRFLPFEEE